MRTGAASALAEAVTSIAALCSGTLRCGRAILRTLHGLPLAVQVGAVIRAFRLTLLLLWMGRRRLRSLGGQRNREQSRGRYDRNGLAQEKNRGLFFGLRVSNWGFGGGTDDQ